MRYPVLLAAAVVTVITGGDATAAKPSQSVARAVADPRRPADDKAADPQRKPAETLTLAGVRPGMAVGEFYSGGGYYTRLLSNVVGASGHVYSLSNSGWGSSKEIAAAMGGKWKNVSFDSQKFGTVGFPKRLDVVWLTQNYHDLKIPKYGNVDTVAFNREVYAALKPGGVYFIIDHQGRPDMTPDEITKLHRVNRDLVVREVSSAGFKLAAEGDFLRNSADDYGSPPSDEKVKGHTDRFVLKFVKPKR
jgi:predicted methyltransferase